MRNTLPLTLVAGALAAGLGGAASAQEPISLRVLDAYANTHYASSESIQHWMALVREKLGDRVTFEFYPAQQLGKSADMLGILQDGVVDIALTAPSYIGDDLALAAVADLPGIPGDQCDATEAFWAIAGDGGLLDREVFEPEGIKVIFGATATPNKLFTTSTPVESVSDMAGLKIRAQGRVGVRLLQELGAVPVQMSGPDVYQAVTRGTVDGAIWPALSIKPYDLQYELAHGLDGVTFGSFLILHSMRRDDWSALPPDVQEAFTQAARETAQHFCTFIDENAQAVLDELSAAGHLELVTVSGENKTEWNAVLNRIQDLWAAELDERGKAGTEVLQAFRAAIENRGD